MSVDPVRSSKRVLEPYDRLSEVLFGLIMVLTFTGSLSVAEAGEEDVRLLLVGALGCNLAWGLIDAVMYLMGCLAEKGTGLRALRALRASSDPRKAQQIVASALPSLIAGVMRPEELDSIQQRLRALPEPPARARLQRRDWIGAAAVFLLVFTSTLPVVTPFVLMENVKLAVRASHGIAILMLFLIGYAFGRTVGRGPWWMGASMVALGLVLAVLTMALGG